VPVPEERGGDLGCTPSVCKQGKVPVLHPRDGPGNNETLHNNGDERTASLLGASKTVSRTHDAGACTPALCAPLRRA
jgi:hypothetical protein